VFVITDPEDVTDATFNLTEFIDEIVAQNLGILPSWHLTSVEFGIEVYKGKGTLDVTAHDVPVGP
jgi:hypothetical protein